jgi:hypothetical protein
MGSFLQFREYLRRGCQCHKRLNQPDKRRPVPEIAGIAGEDVGEGAAEFATTVAQSNDYENLTYSLLPAFL